ncbi:prolipoprotein diacylglyceryl transferase [Novosphingobium album (ex Hu et al. 2023)]|uniref:Phosphatidylglycerol--prolipoprotein diacylglyceryl transferase n=1 Tax=Novosphingobium album (ex Hu et al. 2023) TaxID=2930093 RepID=A0ABT0B717_9SPHN|nr:prolipoprotein diacylglyceryl transferase [Novosphingobium album (ex Hu et al. 2023)]MCJ2180648.1 prolipoprotein diacylglyceryl transferase [Novosphingobium album (ex Hu et al. 2023)]
MSLIQLAAAAAAQVHEPIQWVDLGLRNYLFRIGSFELRWYSLAYLAGILLGYWHLSRMIKAPGAPLAQRHADDLFFYCTLGIILGGRLGYATFYTGGNSDIPSMWLHPAELLQLWHGGMSFHGGLIGVLLALLWVSWRNGLNFVRVADYISVCVPFGMMFGRLANFVNGELWGRVVTDPNLPWAMIFPDGGPLPRHPSQLYEAGLEGLMMILIMLPLFWKTRARFRPGLMVGVFTTGIACARFIVEFFREPDAQLAEFARNTGLSMGQWLTIPLIALGLVLIARALMKPELASGRASMAPVAA